MSDISQVITQLVNHPYFPITVILLCVFVIVYLNRYRIKLNWLNFLTQYKLKHLGVEQISNIKCPDGLGSHLTIDRLLLRPDGITLLIEKKYPGKIYCADHIDDWTQMLGQKRFHFKNPLFELDYQIKAISDCMPNVTVDGYLFFDHLALFPRGRPGRVIHPNCIPDALQTKHKHSVEPDVMEAWENIKALVKA